MLPDGRELISTVLRRQRLRPRVRRRGIVHDLRDLLCELSYDKAEVGNKKLPQPNHASIELASDAVSDPRLRMIRSSMHMHIMLLPQGTASPQP